ncbi:MAG: hypothetical protein ABIO70_34735, partial [Pseudomonadota bacterium]
MARKYVSFEELVGKAGAGQDPAGTTHFGELERPGGQPQGGMPVPGFDRATRVTDVFLFFEAQGLTCHPDTWTRQEAIDRLESSRAAQPDMVEGVTADPMFGINNPPLFFSPIISPAPSARGTVRYNYPTNVMFDLARIGVGTLRHIQGPDLAWLHLFDDTVPIAAPWDMRPLLSDSDWAVLGCFTYLVITCLYTGQQVVPLLFHCGGGSNVPLPAVEAAKPSFQTEAMIPAQAGWDPWYYAPAPQNLSLPQLFQQQVYQRYALNVYTD